MKKREIYTYSMILSLGIISFYFDGFIGLLRFGLSLGLYCTLSYPFYFIWKKLRGKKYLKGKKFVHEFFYRVANITLLLFVILGSFVVFENEFSPATMPLYTISNGKKTVYFQAMVHIGRAEFYSQVQRSLRDKKQNGAVLFYEGVRPGSDENAKKFDEAIGIKFSKELYKNFSKLYGVTFQDNEDFLGIVNDNDFNVDVSIDDIMNLYAKADTKDKTAPKDVTDINELVVNDLALLDEKKLTVLVYLNQAIMNFLIKSDFLKKSLMDEFGNKALFDVILVKRNEVLAKEIEKSEHPQIFVTYGLLHFEGVFALLKAQDPNWKIESVSNLYPFHTPFHF